MCHVRVAQPVYQQEDNGFVVLSLYILHNAMGNRPMGEPMGSNVLQARWETTIDLIQKRQSGSISA
jgi:hypothetical protein